MCNAGLESKLFFGGLNSLVSLVCVWVEVVGVGGREVLEMHSEPMPG